MTTNAELDADLTASLSDEPTALPDETTDDYEARLQTWRDTYTVTGLADADYCGRRYRQAQAAAGDITALATFRKAEIDEWATRARKRHDDTAAFFAGRLEHFHRLERERDVKHNKSVSLPCGVELRSQAGKLSVVVDDEKAAIVWLEQNAASVVVYPEPRVDKTAAAAMFGGKAKASADPGDNPAVTADGEVVPGITIRRSDTTFSIS